MRCKLGGEGAGEAKGPDAIIEELKSNGFIVVLVKLASRTQIVFLPAELSVQK